MSWQAAKQPQAEGLYMVLANLNPPCLTRTNPHVCKQLGLLHTCQQGHTAESIQDAMVELQVIYPNAGAHEMISLLYHKRSMSVSRNVVQEYFATYEPHLIHQCKVCHLQHHHFWAAGVNDIWAVDQHDKWIHFGLALHTGIEPFSGRILWIHIWHSNRNLQLILTYFLDVVDKLRFIPLVTQSDPSSENYVRSSLVLLGINYLTQTMLHQWHDPALEVLEHGGHKGWFDVDNTLQLIIFRWIFIHWLQAGLNAYQDHVNHTAKWCNCNKVLPHSVLELIFRSPQDYGALDLKRTMQLPFNDMDDSYYYMGGVSGGLGLDEIHAHHLNKLDNAKDEPDVIEEGPNVVVTDFSDEEVLEEDWS
ncbi:hypothetical protein EDC04DRAFT_2609165 [Pisolithus marmoratus]|nr:hypothetical protein EDC04DRAFT_2609165 [Pisolithus marmoratus]